MEEIHWLLGMEIKRDREACTIALSQKSYIESMVKQFNLEDVKPSAIPMDPNARLSVNQSPQTMREFAEM